MRLWITLSIALGLIASSTEARAQNRHTRVMRPIVFAQASYRRQAGLPPCTMDSFVHEAKNMAENIYGGESFFGPPPFDGFTQDHRINSGLFDDRNTGLTTGHGSQLPDAWGADEFVSDGEMTASGPQDMSDYAKRPPFDYPAYLRSFWRSVERGGLKF